MVFDGNARERPKFVAISSMEPLACTAFFFFIAHTRTITALPATAMTAPGKDPRELPYGLGDKHNASETGQPSLRESDGRLLTT